MSVLDFMNRHRAEFDTIRHDFHTNPELGLEEHRTAGIVAAMLESWGIEVHRNVGRTGVVGVLRSGNGSASIGLRADMDALPMQEENQTLPYRSATPGLMHACGHDGHTTILLAAARYLAETRNFDGTVNLIFQPGEEGVGGALAMLDDGLLERFPCDALFGLHNLPGVPLGTFAMRSGPAMAGGAFFDITIKGKGAHGARPEDSIDPVLVAGHLITALQSIVARNIPSSDVAVLSITKMTGGDAFNVIPDTATLSGTVRAFDTTVMNRIRTLMERTITNLAEAFGAQASLDYRLIFAPTVNDPRHTETCANVAAELVGEDNVNRNFAPSMGSEDFSFMLERTPGAYIKVGGGPGAALHNPHYNFNDETTPYGAAFFARLVETSLPRMDDA